MSELVDAIMAQVLAEMLAPAPLEAGLAYAVKLDKPTSFLGHAALERQRTEGLRKRLLLFTFDDPAAFPWSGEPILMDGNNVGELSSAGYSRKYGRAVAMGYARADHVLSDTLLLGARFEVDIAGELYAVTPHLKLS